MTFRWLCATNLLAVPPLIWLWLMVWPTANCLRCFPVQFGSVWPLSLPLSISSPPTLHHSPETCAARFLPTDSAFESIISISCSISNAPTLPPSLPRSLSLYIFSHSSAGNVHVPYAAVHSLDWILIYSPPSHITWHMPYTRRLCVCVYSKHLQCINI